MSRENPTWGAPRILSELLLLGYDVAERTVAKYMVRTRKPPSQTWRTFLDNHVPDIAACDFFTVPTVTFRVLYVFIVLRHDRRQVVHFNVTDHPYAEWAAQQIINAFPYEEAPRFLIRDRDGIYGDYFTKRVEGMGIEEVPIAPRSPWQNPYCERLIGSIRRECLDHMIILNEDHLRRILKSYFEYYHNSRRAVCHDILDFPARVLANVFPPPSATRPQRKPIRGEYMNHREGSPLPACLAAGNATWKRRLEPRLDNRSRQRPCCDPPG